MKDSFLIKLWLQHAKLYYKSILYSFFLKKKTFNFSIIIWIPGWSRNVDLVLEQVNFHDNLIKLQYNEMTE